MCDVNLVALRNGDERAFRILVHENQPTLFRLALLYSPSRAVAEEAVQETWLAVLQALDGFAGRGPFRAWICRILVNIARRRAGLENRSWPVSAIDEPNEQHVQPVPSGEWARLPEDTVLSRELREVVDGAIAELPRAQRDVISLRDVDGWTPAEVSELLRIPDGNQRVLLHRARGRVRHVLEKYLNSPETIAER